MHKVEKSFPLDWSALTSQVVYQPDANELESDDDDDDDTCNEGFTDSDDCYTSILAVTTTLRRHDAKTVTCPNPVSKSCDQIRLQTPEDFQGRGLSGLTEEEQ